MAQSVETNKMSFLEKIEVVGNKLPHPVVLFAILAFVTALLSGVLAYFDVTVTGEALDKSGKLVEKVYKVKSLLNREGFSYMLTNVPKNFVGYAPLGTVMIAMFGVGLADLSGYMSAMLKRVLAVVPNSLVVPMLVFVGIMSNIASDAGYVIVVPLGMMIMHNCGRHPFAGFAATLAGVSGGYSANLLIGAVDAMLADIATDAAHIVDPSYTVNAAANWYFLGASTIVLMRLGTFIVVKIIEPRLGEYHGEGEMTADGIELTEVEKKALSKANWALLLTVLVIVALAIPENSFLRNPKTGSLVIGSTLMNGIVTVITIVFFVTGVTYGAGCGRYKNNKDVCKDIGKTLSTMGPFLALAIVASQFIRYFNYTGIGTMISVAGANFLAKANLHYSIILVMFIIFCAFMNLLMASATAKFMLMAPIFVPMFMRVGIAPELTMAAYRIPDSAFNPIAPVMAYLAVMLVYIQKYDKDAGIGTVWSMMLPFSLSFLVIWTALLFVFLFAGIPLGPGVVCFL